MNRIIFQVALLGFFISVIINGTNSLSLLDLIIKSFGIALAILVGGIVLLGLYKFYLTSKPETRSEQAMSENPKAGNNAAKKELQNSIDDARSENTRKPQAAL